MLNRKTTQNSCFFKFSLENQYSTHDQTHPNLNPIHYNLFFSKLLSENQNKQDMFFNKRQKTVAEPVVSRNSGPKTFTKTMSFHILDSCGFLWPPVTYFVFPAGCFLGFRMCFVSASSCILGCGQLRPLIGGTAAGPQNQQTAKRKRGATATEKKQSVPRALEHTVLPFTANITCKRMRSSTREVRFALSWTTQDHGAALSAHGGKFGSRKKTAFVVQCADAVPAAKHVFRWRRIFS